MSSNQSNRVRTMDDAFAAMLAADTYPENVSDASRRNSPMGPGPPLVPIARYVDCKYHELEKQNLWSRVWQVSAARSLSMLFAFIFGSISDIQLLYACIRSLVLCVAGKQLCQLLMMLQDN